MRLPGVMVTLMIYTMPCAAAWISMPSSAILLILLCSMPCAAAWLPSSTSPLRNSATSTSTTLFDATGGWGIGSSRDMTPEEFLKNGERRAFDPYELSEGGDFMRKIKKDRKEMEKSQMDELLGVAKSAGIVVKDPKERLNKFEEDLQIDDDDDLDVSVQWDTPTGQEDKAAASITRMDEDTGSLGSW